MKYAIFLFMAVGLFFTACKKKSNAVGCYVCTTVSKPGSNIPIFDTTSARISYGTICNVNSGQIAFYAKSNSRIDTTRFSYTHDSVFYNTNKVTCVAQ